jgi:hypothetical protein
VHTQPSMRIKIIYNEEEEKRLDWYSYTHTHSLDVLLLLFPRLLAFFLLLFEDPLVVWCVLLLPVLALAVGAAVPHYPARAPLHFLLGADTAAGAVGALVQLVPLVGTPRLHRDQRASGVLAVHFGVDHLIHSHAQSQVLQHSL